MATGQIVGADARAVLATVMSHEDSIGRRRTKIAARESFGAQIMVYSDAETGWLQMAA